MIPDHPEDSRVFVTYTSSGDPVYASKEKIMSVVDELLQKNERDKPLERALRDADAFLQRVLEDHYGD